MRDAIPLYEKIDTRRLTLQLHKRVKTVLLLLPRVIPSRFYECGLYSLLPYLIFRDRCIPECSRLHLPYGNSRFTELFSGDFTGKTAVDHHGETFIAPDLLRRKCPGI